FPLYPPRGAIRPWWFCHKWSTEISDAWEVVEKMKTCGLLVDICQVWDGYSVTFDDGSDFAKEYRHKAETAPHAICIASILAMEDKA
ncbi:MAG: hypothetical protein M0Z35_21720, partial [Desulfitobacterium hafniense]|nr:hypothetical protein [Desulfitobacterium hafniense]